MSEQGGLLGRRHASVALRVAGIYLGLGLAWIFGSDLYLYYAGGQQGPLPVAQLLKGSAFIVASTLVVYGLVCWLNAAAETERRRREGTERGYRALVRSMPDAVFTIDPDSGRILEANRAAEELFLLDRARLIGLERAFHTDTDSPAFQAYHEERLQSGQSRAVLTMIRGDGSRFPADVSSSLFRDETGRLRASCVIRDISEQIERQRSLEASEARLSELTNLQSAILNSVFAHIALVDGDGIVQFANDHWQEYAATGQLPELGAEVGANFLALCDEYQGPGRGSVQGIAEALRAVRSGDQPRADFEFAYAHDGQRRWRRIAMTPFAAEGQKGVVVAHLDVTEQRAAEARRRLVDAAFQSTADAILICDENFLILDANEAYLRVTGFEWWDVLEAKPTFLEIGEQARIVGRALARKRHWRGDLLQRRASGDTFVSWATVNVVKQTQGEPQRLVITFSDMSELREAQERIHHLSYHDPVTNLPNRAALEEWFAQTVKQGAARPMALIYLDLDRFKRINEAFGHGVGDELLKVIAGRLQALTGPHDALARLGGDEFLVVASGIESDEDAVRCAHKLLGAVAEPLDLATRELFTSASAGISLYPRDALSLEELLREADAALDNVKRERRRGGVSCFQHEMRQAVDRQMRIERGLRHAVRRGELELAYQPIVSLPDSIVVGAEALVRWNSPDLGRVSPGEFIPVAEETGLINEIGFWVFEESCRHMQHWRGLSTCLEHISLNVSMSQFQQPGLVEQFDALLKRYRLPGTLFLLEVTESVMMLDPEWAIDLLDGLRQLGINIAIDDFGTGYSSMSYLRRLPVEYLKLDQSFIGRLPDSKADAHIMYSIIELAHRLGIRVVAEGIETEEQFVQLRDWGCDEAQGYFFEHPVSSAEFERMLAEGDLRRAHKQGGNATRD